MTSEFDIAGSEVGYTVVGAFARGFGSAAEAVLEGEWFCVCDDMANNLKL